MSIFEHSGIAKKHEAPILFYLYIVNNNAI